MMYQTQCCLCDKSVYCVNKPDDIHAFFKANSWKYYPICKSCQELGLDVVAEKLVEGKR